MHIQSQSSNTPPEAPDHETNDDQGLLNLYDAIHEDGESTHSDVNALSLIGNHKKSCQTMFRMMSNHVDKKV